MNISFKFGEFSHGDIQFTMFNVIMVKYFSHQISFLKAIPRVIVFNPIQFFTFLLMFGFVKKKNKKKTMKERPWYGEIK